MRERPIILNGDMVRAVLNGSKTQTRRILTTHQLKMIEAAAHAGECYPLESGNQHANSQSYYREWCPFGLPGDRLWVRETWARYNIDQNSHDMAYRATTPEDWPKEGRWRPSIHMPRWASRITLEITGVRVERLQDISEADARSEGVQPMKTAAESLVGGKLAFAELWASVYGYDGAKSWQTNPWVWVIEFKRVVGE